VDAAIRLLFQQFMPLARDVLTEFREVEHNFHRLGRLWVT
jgi:hypothetical protein